MRSSLSYPSSMTVEANGDLQSRLQVILVELVALQRRQDELLAEASRLMTVSDEAPLVRLLLANPSYDLERLIVLLSEALDTGVREDVLLRELDLATLQALGALRGKITSRVRKAFDLGSKAEVWTYEQEPDLTYRVALKDRRAREAIETAAQVIKTQWATDGGGSNRRP